MSGEGWETTGTVLDCECPQRRHGKHLETCSMLSPDWGSQCEACGASPVLPLTGLCGPCQWGEAETAGGNW